MKKSLPIALVTVCMASATSAQFYTPNGQNPIPSVTTVSNEGVAVGSYYQNAPFYMWDAISDSQKLIGGISSGQGVGGHPRFSADSKLIAAPMESDRINVYDEWTSNTFQTMSPYVFCQTCYVSDWNLFAIGSTPDGKEGVIMKSTDNGVSWRRADNIPTQQEDGSWQGITPDFAVHCIANAQYGTIVVGGDKGTLLAGGGNGEWYRTKLTGFTLDQPIKSYRAMNFSYREDEYGNCTADKGCVLLELEDGSFTIVYTLDGTDSFSIAEGFAAKPESLGNNGTDFFLGTSDGTIQVSKDGGKTWNNVFTDPSAHPFHRIVFADDKKGVALSDNVIFITRDGGETWALTEVFPSLGFGDQYSSTWNDAVWNDDFLMIIGTNACCYRSDDNGVTFKRADGFSGDLGTMFHDARKVCTIIGQDGNVWRKADNEYISGYTAALYDVENETWTPLASSGYVSDDASSPWGISGDGKHVVGQAYGFNETSEKVIAHAAIWDGTDKVTLLDNRFADTGRACRANATNYDGSVVVDW